MLGRRSALIQSCTYMQISLSIGGSDLYNFVLLCKSRSHEIHKVNEPLSSTDIIQSPNTKVRTHTVITACIFLDDIE